ncbi:Sll0314/Alr1548 family TPR repeat-containing protein [Okeania sp. SIO1I7]|uniref:Sll0314/Alr1548 family TPR repeat-containing protein n=1 Tax=Okeania sp. SIO1I7 TaxID=2607772 RepID=UPI0013FCDEF7|nr:Sll0314/Alr1548 family TPR repeat-containing protein [Okeania sp. SIO1I7]NET24874.1 tetratricopeptide repeat protein [Okeania sp. SIO1I7]
MRKILFNWCQRKSVFKQISVLSSATFISLNLLVNPAIGDPFRQKNPIEIGEKTEAAFKAMFEEGDYKQAKDYLKIAESEEISEPLVYAMISSLHYLDENWESLKLYAQKTTEVAENLITINPVRGNIYAATGQFLEGAYIISTEGTLKGAPKALEKLRKALSHFETAERINSSDPELNLLKGYMDLMLAVNLPFSDPEKAIKTLQEKAYPHHLAYRGVAVAYRDLDKLEKALEYVDKVLLEVPDNPEVHYLKAQILVAQARDKDNDLSMRKKARENFDMALEKSDKMPRRLVAQVFFEQCKNINNIDDGKRPCDPMRDAIRDGSGTWGPTELPLL